MNPVLLVFNLFVGKVLWQKTVLSSVREVVLFYWMMSDVQEQSPTFCSVVLRTGAWTIVLIGKMWAWYANLVSTLELQ